MTDADVAPPVPFNEGGLLVTALKTRGPGQALVKIIDVPAANFVVYVTSVHTADDPDDTTTGSGRAIVLECAATKFHDAVVDRIPEMRDGGGQRRLRLPLAHMISLSPQGAEALAAELVAWARGDIPVPEHATEEGEDHDTSDGDAP